MRKLGILVRFLASAAALLGLVTTIPGCSKGCGGPAGGGDVRTRVTVSIFPVYDLVRRVAGPDADVVLIVPPGKSEHGFTATPRDVETARQSKLGVMVGLGLDPWMEALMKEAAPTARILKVGDRVPTLTIKDDQEKDGAEDPHVWLDPQRAQLIVRAVAEELGRIDRAHTLGYRQRATELDGSLVALDQESETRLKALKQRGFVTFHGAFGYFAERYKLSILGVVEPVPGTPPAAGHLAKLASVIRERNVGALFSEPQLDPGPAKALAEEIKIPVGVLDPVGGATETDTYEKTIRADVAALERFLK